MGVPIFDEVGDLKQVVVSSRPIRTLAQLDGYSQFLSEAKSYAEDKAKIIPDADFGAQRRLLWNSREMKQVHELIIRAAPTNATVLLTGESGVGKEVVADELYRLSDRRTRPLSRSTAPLSRLPCWKVSCSAMKRGLSPVPTPRGKRAF